MNGNSPCQSIPVHEVSVLRRTGSFLSGSVRLLLSMSLRSDVKRPAHTNKTMRGLLFVIAGLFVSTAHATVNVYFKSSTGTLQSDFIAAATNQYVAAVAPSPYFPDTVALTITGKKNYTPPAVSSPIVDATAVDRLFTYGYAFGQLDERDTTLDAIDHFSVSCSTNTPFNKDLQPWDTNVCYAVLRTIYDHIFIQNLSSGTARVMP